MATYQEIHDLITENLASGKEIPASKHRDVEYALLDYIQLNLAQQGDIKAIKCDVSYLNANFEVSGLGKNLRAGWAICNGNIHNGFQTDNISGKTIVGYGNSFALNQEFGSSDTVLVSHSHTSTGNTNLDTGSSDGVVRQRAGAQNGGTGLRIDTTISTEGVSGAGKNYQPSVIKLYIQKI